MRLVQSESGEFFHRQVLAANLATSNSAHNVLFHFVNHVPLIIALFSRATALLSSPCRQSA